MTKDELPSTTIQDLGVVVVVSGEKLISRYPVDSSYFSRMKLKMKLDGEDYVFGDTIIGCEGTMLSTLDINVTITKVIRMVMSLDLAALFLLMKGFKGLNDLLSIILLSISRNKIVWLTLVVSYFKLGN